MAARPAYDFPTGLDCRGWIFVDFPPARGVAAMPVIFRCVISDKPIQVVLQDNDILRVYVNPDKQGADEWEVPVGSGIKIQVVTPAFDTTG